MMRRLYGGVVRTDAPSYLNVSRLDHGVLPMISDMERYGMRVHLPALTTLSARLTARQEGLARQVEDLIGRSLGETNLRSPDQLADLLYEELGIPTDGIRMTKSRSRHQVDGKTLARFRDTWPVVQAYLNWKECATLKSNFVDKLPTLIRADGRIHTELQVTRTATGRLASKSPNLSNIPTRTEEGKLIREAFICDDGYVLYSIDHSQIELRVICDNSRCRGMIEAFRSGIDLHTWMASKMFKVPVALVDKFKHRLPAKNMNFGIAYGITAQGLLEGFYKSGAMDWTLDQCEQLITDYFRAYPEIREYLDLQTRRAMAYGCVWDMWGRTRLMPEINSTDRAKVSKCLREAGNMPIQSGAQGMMKLCMAELHQLIADLYPCDYVRPLMQIHDELLFEVREEVVEDFDQVCLAVFRACAPLVVPVEAGSKWGSNWGMLKD